MKKYLSLLTLLLPASLILNAQQTDRTGRVDRTSTQKNTKAEKKAAMKQKDQHTTTMPSGTANPRPSDTTGITGTTGTMDEGGQLSSTGRYAAMGVQRGSLHAKDLKFVMLANSSNALELQLSELALRRTTNPAVQSFANMMVQHHRTAGQEMKQLLSNKGAMIPDSALLPRHRTQIEMLQNLQGADFDRAYMRIMVDAHEEDVDEYEDETKDARDADLRAFTTKMLPTLRTHYTHAKDVRRQIR